MRAPIDVTIRHRDGREESFTDVTRAAETEDATVLEIEYVLADEGFVTETYDALDWRIVSAVHSAGVE